MMLRAIAIVLGTATLGACASLAPPAETGARTPRDASPPPVDSPAAGRGPSETARAPSPAAASLLEQSRTARSAGRYADAAVAIERALAIEPNDPALWLELAEIKLADNDPAQAEIMARKALTLAAGDPAVERRAARLID